MHMKHVVVEKFPTNFYPSKVPQTGLKKLREKRIQLITNISMSKLYFVLFAVDKACPSTSLSLFFIQPKIGILCFRRIPKATAFGIVSVRKFLGIDQKESLQRRRFQGQPERGFGKKSIFKQSEMCFYQMIGNIHNNN